MSRRYCLLLALTLSTTTILLGDELPNAAKTQEAIWNDVRGRIIWKGDPIPQPQEINSIRDRCCLKNGPILAEDLVINPKNRGVRWVFVWLAPDPKNGPKSLPVHPALRKPAESEVVIEQSGCRYVPHAAALREGQKLVVKNCDECAHNLHYVGDPQVNGVHSSLVPTATIATIEHLRVQKWPILMRCNIHPWMKGYLRIFEHPYFAITDADGRFEIKKAPIGEWRVVVWHEKNGWRGGREGKDGVGIVIRPDQPADLGDWVLNP